MGQTGIRRGLGSRQGEEHRQRPRPHVDSKYMSPSGPRLGLSRRGQGRAPQRALPMSSVQEHSEAWALEGVTRQQKRGFSTRLVGGLFASVSPAVGQHQGRQHKLYMTIHAFMSAPCRALWQKGAGYPMNTKGGNPMKHSSKVAILHAVMHRTACTCKQDHVHRGATSRQIHRSANVSCIGVSCTGHAANWINSTNSKVNSCGHATYRATELLPYLQMPGTETNT